MKQISWKIVAVLLVICLIIGVFLGISIQSNCSIDIDNKIRYSELLNWFTTIAVGFWVGYVLKNRFENDKVVKGYLLEDIKKISTDLAILKDHCYSLKNVETFTEDQRKEINSKINLIDKKITIFCNFLKECYEKKHKEISDNLINSFNGFNRKITGDGFYDAPLTKAYFDEIMNEGAKFEGELRKLTLKIIKEI